MTEEIKKASALEKIGSAVANPIVIVLLVLAFFIGNFTRPVNFKGCNAQVDSTSATGTIKSDSIIQGQGIDNLDSVIKARKDSLHKADSAK